VKVCLSLFIMGHQLRPSVLASLCLLFAVVDFATATLAIEETLLNGFLDRLLVHNSPDVRLNLTQIVQRKGYVCETHHATTKDGYILTLFRLPYARHQTSSGSPRPPVLLQHGLLDSAFTWVLNMPDQSLAYILADAGYDVWLGNNRGNIYSLKHTSLNTSDHAFWQFSWDEMARYDVPGEIDYILHVTGYRTLAYIGHSEGTIQMFAALTTQPELPLKLSTFIGFGPVVSVAHEQNAVMRILADLDLDVFISYFGIDDFMPDINKEKDPLLYFLFVVFCTDCSACCANVIELICGRHNGAFNDSRMPVVVTHEPGGTSVQNIQHWAQAIRTGGFEMFDYGQQGNMKHYNQSTPPKYDLSRIPASLPMAMYSGSADLLADPTDVANLIAALPKGVYWKNIPHYAHLDFAWALDAAKLMYGEVLQQLATWHPSR